MLFHVFGGFELYLNNRRDRVPRRVCTVDYNLVDLNFLGIFDEHAVVRLNLHFHTTVHRPPAPRFRSRPPDRATGTSSGRRHEDNPIPGSIRFLSVSGRPRERVHHERRSLLILLTSS